MKLGLPSSGQGYSILPTHALAVVVNHHHQFVDHLQKAEQGRTHFSDAPRCEATDSDEVEDASKPWLAFDERVGICRARRGELRVEPTIDIHQRNFQEVWARMRLRYANSQVGPGGETKH